MPNSLRFLLGTAFTASLCYSAWWVWEWAEKAIKGTPVGEFKFFGSVLAVFALLSLVQLAVNLTARARRAPPGSSSVRPRSDRSA